MVWSEYRKIAFFHVTKTAGWSIADLLKKQYQFNRDMYRHGGPKIGEKKIKLKDYTTFAVVRNPFDRLLSWYYHSVFTILDIKNRGRTLDKEQKLILEKGLTFKDFVENIKYVYRDNRKVKMNFRQSQYDFLRDSKGNLPDFILKFENLEEDWKNFCESVELDYKPLPKLNASRVKTLHYSRYYDNDTLSKVSRWYQEDLDNFGYTYEKHGKNS